LTIEFVVNKGNQVLYELAFSAQSLQLTLIKMVDPEREGEKGKVVYESKTNCGSKLQVDFMKFICFVKSKLNAHRPKRIVEERELGFSLSLNEKFNIF